MSLELKGFETVCKSVHELTLEKHTVTLLEPTVRQWGEYRALDIDKLYNDNPFGLHVYVIGIISPSGLMVFTELSDDDKTTLIKSCLKVMGEGFNGLEDKPVILTEGRSEAQTKTFLNFSYLVAKGVKYLHMTPNEVLEMSYFKLEELLHGMKALEAEDNLLKMQVQNSGLLLKSNEGAKKYKSLQKNFLSIIKDLGVKVITTVPDFSWMIPIADKQKEESDKDGSEINSGDKQ